ncbi:hypothetical protein BV210_03645 [Halorientalis sp. IM1011]|uniref:hypothetical protein n=1 Tax=Halorientalis sp. IM1011 TaxID=1932360 RepID=UPI00097CC589|nr:hypothetical protein [Halorientalis sp. IM1011]AQL41864.1 hypothetical protein BV210_03645 [Halorientalis sp. IM1011]
MELSDARHEERRVDTTVADGPVQTTDDRVEAREPLWCPGCETELVRSETVYEHESCGHVDLQRAFECDEGVQCPACEGPGQLEFLRRVASVLRCDDCGQLFDAPPRPGGRGQ